MDLLSYRGRGTNASYFEGTFCNFWAHFLSFVASISSFVQNSFVLMWLDVCDAVYGDVLVSVYVDLGLQYVSYEDTVASLAQCLNQLPGEIKENSNLHPHPKPWTRIRKATYIFLHVFYLRMFKRWRLTSLPDRFYHIDKRLLWLHLCWIRQAQSLIS